MRDLGIAFSLRACTKEYLWRNKFRFGDFFFNRLPLYLEMLAKQDSFIIICPENWSLVKIEPK